MLVAGVINQGRPMLMLGLVVIPVGILLLNHQRFLYALVIATMFSGLYVPGLPPGVGFQTLLSVVYILLCILNMAVTRKSNEPVSGHLWIKFFLVHIGLVIVLNGSGFRFLGSEEWGGLRYVQIVIALLLMLNARQIIFTPREWKLVLLAALGFAMVPLVAESLFLLSQGRLYFLYYLVRFDQGTVSALVSDLAGTGLVRFQSGNRAGVLLVMFALVLYLTGTRKMYLAIPLYLFGVMLVGFSGHRSGFLDIMILTAFAFIVRSGRRGWKWRAIAVSGGGLVALLLIYLGAAYLPLTFQRMVSFLPGIQIHPTAMIDAQFTAEWRINLWSEAMNIIRQSARVFWLGRGYTYSGAEFEALNYGTEGEYVYWWAYITLTFHQGILSLLVGTGIVGLLLFMGLTGKICWDHLRLMFSSWPDEMARKIHLFLGFYFVLQTVKYYVFFGDLYFSLPILSYWYLIIEGLNATVRQEKRKERAEEPGLQPWLTKGISVKNRIEL